MTTNKKNPLNITKKDLREIQDALNLGAENTRALAAGYWNRDRDMARYYYAQKNKIDKLTKRLGLIA